MSRLVPTTMRRLALVACVAIAGCSGGGGGGGGGAAPPRGDVTPPQVAGVSPSGVEVDIIDAAQISAVFSETIDPNSVSSTSFRVTEAGGAPVSGSISVETSTIPPNPSTARFTPVQPLARSTEYRVTLTTAIKDLAGNALAADHNASFTTITDRPWMPTSVTLATASGRFDHVAVWTDSEMIVFGGFAGAGGPQITNTGARYNPGTDSWTTMANNGIGSSVTAVWTGSEMIVWNGVNGERYNPISNTWAPVSQASAPLSFSGHTAVWTGAEMIAWGGMESSLATLNTGGRFNPTNGMNGTWSATSTAGAPSPRVRHSAVWTDTEMIVWGGASFPAGGGDATLLGDGARYDPASNTWLPISATGAPTPRLDHTAVWTGQEMIVWGGLGEDGGRYNPATDSWTPLPSAGFRLAFVDHTAIWTGSEMIVWGGFPVSEGSLFKLGARYNPATNAWRPVTKENNSLPHRSHTAVWTGTAMIIWGGVESTTGSQTDPPGLQTGARYAP